jgi:hypothetical protein
VRIGTLDGAAVEFRDGLVWVGGECVTEGLEAETAQQILADLRMAWGLRFVEAHA